ncbi:small ribosomal subunit protein uS12m [Atheta coriaria]|uniref:small ribosomal subunit protein uS12m n=1 Tax=Dalotia coriaria TaxID=877792 RepID=UPI0031F3E3D7
MNVLRQLISRVPQTHSMVRNILTSSAQVQRPLLQKASELTNGFSFTWVQERFASLYQMHRRGPHFKTRKPRQPLDGRPFMKGVVLKTLIKKPKKPNSANRKCVLVRLSNGKEMVSYIPGIGHNLQEHNIVLCRVGRLKDCPGVKLKCVRGKYDLSHVIQIKK